MTSNRPKILVVDDTPANLVAMRRLLARADADIFEAASGNEALALCLDHQFALVLLDVNMPEMDGFEVAKLISESDHLSETPIIFVTAAYADDVNRIKGYTSGAVDYIAKPINDVILQSKVRVFLELYRARALLQQALDELSLRNEQLSAEVAERTRMEELVRHQATHDALTGIPNRVLFRDRLEAAIALAEERDAPFALAYIDIDGFKGVNDNEGHAAGDALLKVIAARIAGRTRASDTVARLGGDEFAVLLHDAPDASTALARCQTLCDVIAQPYTLDVGDRHVPAQVGASIGVTLYRAGAAYDDIVAAADEAMYTAKRSGKNRCVLG
ncbi:diguanylate cyclase [Luteibacter flocculans]|uniref:Diguanylate cyclase n=1 Tax=Luteibacter flocculans TaxID=2780091 RepID=A0ABY4SYC5_9GAMM|nr:diguanylate cyclase [Luteibacter flocculans]URL57723.1 diguanylate cyclase [Luteibacter flocculans]